MVHDKMIFEGAKAVGIRFRKAASFNKVLSAGMVLTTVGSGIGTISTVAMDSNENSDSKEDGFTKWFQVKLRGIRKENEGVVAFEIENKETNKGYVVFVSFGSDFDEARFLKFMKKYGSDSSYLCLRIEAPHRPGVYFGDIGLVRDKNSVQKIHYTCGTLVLASKECLEFMCGKKVMMNGRVEQLYQDSLNRLDEYVSIEDYTDTTSYKYLSSQLFPLINDNEISLLVNN